MADDNGFTAHSLALLVLLQEYCRGMFGDSGINESQADDKWPAATRHTISHILVREIRAAPGRATTHTFHALFTELEAIADDGPEVAGLVRDTLFQVQSPESIFALTDAFRELIIPTDGAPSVEPNSMLGIFVRRSLLDFNKMDFRNVSKLYRQVVEYNSLDGPMPRRATPMPVTPTPAGRAVTPAGGYPTASHGGSAAAVPPEGLHPDRDAPRILARARELAQQGASAEAIAEGLPASLARMTQLPVTHYVRHVCAVQKGDLTGAVDSLHRYFDLQAISAGWTPSGGGTATDVSGRPSRAPFHHAALSLGAIHHTFGNRAEAMAAVLETIRIAQEHSDDDCLQHALGWLARFDEGPASLELTKLLLEGSRTRDTPEGRAVHGLAQLLHAKKLFTTGQPCPEVLDGVAASYSTSVLSSIDELMGMCFMLQSGLFDFYGHGHLSALYAQIHLRNRNPGSPDDGCAAYCQLALHHTAAGEDEVASQLLSEARFTYQAGTPASRIWAATTLEIEFQRALSHEDWAAAEALERSITGFATADGGEGLTGEDVGVRVDAGFRQALLHLARRQYDRVAAVVDCALQAIDADLAAAKPSLPLARVKQVRLARLLAEAHHAAENHTGAVVTIVGCIKLAVEHKLALEVAAARVLYADVLLGLGRPGAARRLLNRALPVVLGHGALEEKGKAHLVHGKCLVASARGSTDALQVGVAALEKARAAFARLGARAHERRSLYLLARTLDELGDTTARDEMAGAFVLLKQLPQSAQ